MRLDRVATLGLFHPLARLARDAGRARSSILMYHSVSEANDTARHPYFMTNTTPAQFALQMQVLKDCGCDVVPLRDIADAPGARSSGASPRVAITFDDGYRDFLVNAFPVLARLGYPAHVFLPTRYVGEQSQTFNDRPCLTWSEVRELHAAGVEFGSHTVTHPQLYDVPAPILGAEVLDSKLEIEQRLGSEVAAFSYPYAFPEHDTAFSNRLRSLLERCGYRYGVSTIVGTTVPTDDAYFLPRLPVNLKDDAKLLLAKIDGGYDWVHAAQLTTKRIKQTRRRLQSLASR